MSNSRMRLQFLFNFDNTTSKGMRGYVRIMFRREPSSDRTARQIPVFSACEKINSLDITFFRSLEGNLTILANFL